MEESDKALSELVEHLVTDASSVIFLQIALGQLTHLTQKLNAPDIDRVALRLVNEGFGDAAKKAYRGGRGISDQLISSGLLMKDRREDGKTQALYN